MSGVRHFPEMWEKLMDLQIAIYALDRYFESSWIIQGAELDRLWGRIRKELGVLSDGGGIDEPLRDIQCYQKVEEGLRHGGAEDLPDLPKYYYLKTCDVRLSRVLLEECAPVTRRAVRLSSWGVYDAASEVMDDVEDLYEDTENFNGNRLLLGIGLRGVEATLDGYNTFLKLLEREAVRLGRPADRLSEQPAPQVGARSHCETAVAFCEVADRPGCAETIVGAECTTKPDGRGPNGTLHERGCIFRRRRSRVSTAPSGSLGNLDLENQFVSESTPISFRHPSPAHPRARIILMCSYRRVP